MNNNYQDSVTHKQLYAELMQHISDLTEKEAQSVMAYVLSLKEEHNQ